MKVRLGSNYLAKHLLHVTSLSDASRAVRDFIDAHDLTAGCGSGGDAFVGGEVYEDKAMIARVSYNGRVWDLDGKEILV